MGQKHNRRRIRPRSRNRVNFQQQQRYQEESSLPPLAIAHPVPLQGQYQQYQLPYPYTVSSPLSSHPSTGPLERRSISNASDSIPTAPARRWHNRYTAWQNREEKQRQEAAKIEAEQCRLFGGEPGDDVALCYRMLEYFGGLDYIDGLRDDGGGYPWG